MAGVPVVARVGVVRVLGADAGRPVRLEGRDAVLTVGVHSVEGGVVVRRAAAVRRSRLGRRPRRRSGPRQTLRAAEQRRESITEETLVEQAVARIAGASLGLGLAAEGTQDTDAEHQDRDDPDDREHQQAHLPADGDAECDTDGDAEPEHQGCLDVGLEHGTDRRAQQEAEHDAQQSADGLCPFVVPCLTHHETPSRDPTQYDPTASITSRGRL